jgi:NAD(P)-dependent dehydrogenase (short-subunit alcohol dehydrogenase family)
MFTGKVVLVTGASAGIGRVVAEAFAAQGAKVGLLARRADRLEAVSAAIAARGGVALPLPADVGREEDLKAAVDRLVAHFGRLDVLVNNAGAGIFGRTPSAAEFDRIFAVNVRAVWSLSLLALPHLRESGGNIVNLGSAVIERPFAGELVYLASKGAVAAMTRGMAATWGPLGVRVNLVLPGVIESEFLTAAGLPPEVAEAHYKVSEQLNALPTTGRAEDVAKAVLYLASDQARFVTGAELRVDGGFALAAVRGEKPAAMEMARP